MKKMSFVSAVLVMFGLSARAATTCYVSQENPSVPNQYDQLLATAQVKEGEARIIYSTAAYSVSASTVDGGMQIATFSNKEHHKIFALASSSGDKLVLLDPNNQISVNCLKQ